MPVRTLYDESELLLRLAQGDEAAFTAIYNRYWSKLYFLAYTHLRTAAAAEEIVQEIFLVLWEKRGQLEIGSLSLYLAAMVRYAVYRYLGKQKKYRQTAIDSLSQETAGADWEFPSDNKLLLEIIEKLSNQLPEKCRLVFIHNKLMDEPIGQVARNLNMSSKTAEAHLTKALKVIRRKFGDVVSGLFMW